MKLLCNCTTKRVAIILQLHILSVRFSVAPAPPTAMVLEMLHRIVLLTSGAAALVWGIASTVELAAIFPATAAIGIASATILLTPNSLGVSSLANPSLPAARKKGPSTSPEAGEVQFPATITALILWISAAISLAYTVFQTNITSEDLGFFSIRALLLCWLCVVPLFLPRISPRARRIESSESSIANSTSDPT